MINSSEYNITWKTICQVSVTESPRFAFIWPILRKYVKSPFRIRNFHFSTPPSTPFVKRNEELRGVIRFWRGDRIASHSYVKFKASASSLPSPDYIDILLTILLYKSLGGLVKSGRERRSREEEEPWTTKWWRCYALGRASRAFNTIWESYKRGSQNMMPAPFSRFYNYYYYTGRK